jgi:DNA topoisomerase I
VQHGKTFANLPDVEEVFTIGLNRAVDLIAEKRTKGPGRFQRGAAPAGRALGDHPDGGPMTVRDGRYGPYVNWGTVNATLPKALNKDTLTFEQALDLVRAKQASGGGESGGKSAPRKAAGKAPRKSAKSAKNGKG